MSTQDDFPISKPAARAREDDNEDKYIKRLKSTQDKEIVSGENTDEDTLVQSKTALALSTTKTLSAASSRVHSSSSENDQSPFPPKMNQEASAPTLSYSSSAILDHMDWIMYKHQNFSYASHSHLLTQGDVVILRAESCNGKDNSSDGCAGKRVIFHSSLGDDRKKYCLIQEIMEQDHPESKLSSCLPATALQEYPRNPTLPELRQVKWKRLLPVFQQGSFTEGSASSTSAQQPKATTIMIVPNTATYRLMAMSQLLPSDCVLEIGCSTGETSVLVWEQMSEYYESGGNHGGNAWIGMDTSSTMVEATQQRLNKFLETTWNVRQKSNYDELEMKRSPGKTPNPPFRCTHVNPLLDPTEAYNAATASFTMGSETTRVLPSIVFLDIGGCREVQGVVRMLDWVVRSFASSCRFICVKSQQVHQQAMLTLSQQQGGNKPDNMKPTIRSGPGCVPFPDGSAWFQDQLVQARCQALPRHPLQAPKQWNPTKPSQMICRYHNYHPQGCAKHGDGSTCPHDHEHCHMCQQKDHIARLCPLLYQSHPSSTEPE